MGVSSTREHSHWNYCNITSHCGILPLVGHEESLCFQAFPTYFTFLGFFASSVCHMRPHKAVLPSGQLLVVGGGSSGVSWRMDPHGAWLTPHWHNTKPAIEAQTSAPAVCCLHAPTADVRHESQLCSPRRGADHQTSWRHVHADEDPNCLNLCLDTNPGCCGYFFFIPARCFRQSLCKNRSKSILPVLRGSTRHCMWQHHCDLIFSKIVFEHAYDQNRSSKVSKR